MRFVKQVRCCEGLARWVGMVVVAVMLLASIVSCGDDGSPVDVSPPAPVVDLAAAVVTPYAAVLSFTAPGNDGATGRAASYDIRYAPAPIDGSSWSAATQMTGATPPRAPGSRESIEVGGLDANTTYYFAVKTRDGSGNVSGISNSPSATTMPEAFAPVVNYPTGSTPRSLVAVNVDADVADDIDLVCGNASGDNSISVLANNGDGTFAAPVSFAPNYPEPRLAVGDLDDDRKSDLVAAVEARNELVVWLGDGAGGFTPQTPIDLYQPRAVAVADVDGVAPDDIIVGMGALRDSIAVLTNNGDASFASAVRYAVDGLPRAIVACDFDGDADTDIAVGTFPYGLVHVFLNNGDGTFADRADYDIRYEPLWLVTADMDGDSDADIVVATEDGDAVPVMVNDGDGTFTIVTNDGAAFAVITSVAAGDFDGDGDNDVMATGRTGVYLLLNRGDATFWPARLFPTGPNPHTIVAADLNGAGLMDVAVTIANTDSISVFINNVTP